MNKLFLFLIIGIVFVSGCAREIYPDGDEVVTVQVEVEYVNECGNDYDCNRYFTSGDRRECVKNVCVSYLEDCKEIAKQDYNMERPKCRYYKTCTCEDYIVDSPEKRIEKGNSTQIIRETGHYENYLEFEIKND